MSRPSTGSRRSVRLLIALSSVVLAASSAIPTAAVTAPPVPSTSAQATPTADVSVTDAPHGVTGFTFVKTAVAAPCPPPNVSGFLSTYFQRGDCFRADLIITNTPTSRSFAVTSRFIGPAGGAPFATANASRFGGVDNQWRVIVPIGSAWPAGRITMEVTVDGQPADGRGVFFVNQLGATIRPTSGAGPFAPGDAIPLEGDIHKLNDVAGNTERSGAPGATFKVRVTAPDGTVLHTSDPVTASSAPGGEGEFSYTVPGAATASVSAGPAEQFEITLGLEVIQAAHDDVVPAIGPWAGDPAGSGSALVVDEPNTLLIENSFVSSTGWVKPGDTYPFRVIVRNFTSSPATGVTVDIPAPDGVTFQQATPLSGSGSASIAGDGSIDWTIGPLAAAANGVPSTATLVVDAKADTLAQDAEIVWKDLSSTAALTYSGGPGGLSAESHGPKVIPPGGGFETARYGDKPFPMVPVDYRDRKHEPEHSGERLERVVNSPNVPGSTFNLYQEMSYGQLFPFGEVPSSGIASAGFDYEPGFDFTQYEVDPDDPRPTCRGTTVGGAEPTWGTPLYPERISDGWYQLPGDTEYYGGDYPAFTLGVGSQIDAACGDTSKSVYDAAVIADPEIDYDRFDGDKDGVVDFFMMVFVGLGGNGDSQINGVPPYDNIWPHSSSLEHAYRDPATGLSGYISDDQLTDHEGRPQCWTSAAYQTFDTCASAGGTGQNDRPAYVRVGPYNVNPESAIEAASVISHEYGHHLGLPDFYSTSYSAYNDWNLMAGDYSQHMTIFSKQDLGWVVPRFLQPNESVTNTDWEEIKNDTGSIRWQRPDGGFYTLSQANGDQNIHNGEAYGLKLPRRLIIDPQKVAEQASAPYVWYSGRGNDFGCPPSGGHNLDIRLDELADLAPGTSVTLTYKSSWDIEWDFDYGFTMVTTNGQDYTSLPSAKGYTTPRTTNPNGVACQDDYGNGLTGQSGAYQAGPAQVAAARAPESPSAYSNGSPFLEDEYDLSAYAGRQNVVLRFSYSTDPGFDRPGWFVDDLKVSAGSQVLYETNFDDEEELRIFPGGCIEGRQTAARCTAGWSRIKADEGAPQDHAYYLELRDRSGFDANGRGQSDRGDIGWAPGALIEYTDEVRGYGNTGGGMPPRQHYLDSRPQPGMDCGDNLYEENPPDVLTAPRCQDAAFTAATGDKHFDDDPSGGADPGDWVDNFADSTRSDGRWHFDYGCLSLDVTSMSGTNVSESLPSNLTANATIRALTGCAPFSYTGAYPNTRPNAVAVARPTTAAPNQNIVFDGSGSSDDRDAPEALVYRWDFTNNGTYDATGQVVNHAYARAGTYTAKLQVRDAQGLTDTALVTVTVRSLPDLDVTRVTLTNIETSNGRRVRMSATIKNIGTARARESRTTFNLDDRTVPNPGSVVTKALSPGESVTVSKVWDARDWPGQHELRVYADHRWAVAESNERNNGFKRTFTVRNGRVVQ